MAHPEGRIDRGAGRRLAVCYVAPGQHLLATAGPTRNILNLASALAQYADVTVAFRSCVEAASPVAVPVIEIDPNARRDRIIVDDAAVRGVGVAEFLRYTRTIRRFVRDELPRFDLVFEKSWTLSGLVAAQCKRIGVPGLVIENLVPVVDGKSYAHLGPVKRAKLFAGRAFAGRMLRQADRIIAETSVLKAAMEDCWRIPGESISVVALGVDRSLFAPQDQGDSRRELDLSSSSTILLYSGILDQTHNLLPVVEALGRARAPGVELHVIGDGALRTELERRAGANRANIHFHGRVPYELVPRYIAAADLCLAPYEPEAFPGRQVAYSSLKIPEYMSVGRAVVSVPSGRVLELVKHGVTGFLFDNVESEWTHFLGALPERASLAAMGKAALMSKLYCWDDVARKYLEVGRAEIAARGGP